MARLVRPTALFIEGLAEDAEGLIERNRLEWFELLEADVVELIALLSTAPRIGKLMARRNNRELRRAALKRTPYFVWYAVDAGPSGAVTLLRLSHTRQRGARRIRW